MHSYALPSLKGPYGQQRVPHVPMDHRIFPLPETHQPARAYSALAGFARPYGVALLVTMAAALLRWALQPVMGASSPYITFYLAVVGAAAAGGFGPGILVTILGAICGGAMLGMPTLVQPAEQVRLIIYLISGVGISLIAGALHRAQQRAAGHAQRVNRTLESMGDAYLLLDRAWSIIGMNGQAERVLHRGPDELIGRNLWQAFPQADAFRGAYERAMTGGQPEYIEAFYAPMNVWFSSRAVPFDGGLALFFRDITESRRAEEALRASEQRYRMLFESIDEGFCVIEMIFDERNAPTDYRLLELNPAFETHTGLQHAAGKTARELVPELDEFWFKTYGEVALTGQPIRFESHAPAMGRWFDVHASRIAGPDSRRVALMFNDITRRKQAEEALKNAKLAAEEASHAKDHFLAVLSHELRTPLTPVLTTADILARDLELPERYREDVAMIRRNVEVEARLIDDLLDVTRIARGKIELDRRPADLREIIQRAVEVCRADIESRQLQFSLDPGSASSYPIHADAARLQQVFWNLLKNAVKFTLPGGSVQVRCRPDGDEHVLAEVIDSGEGIDPSLLPHIFKPFEQGGRETTRQFGGLGLGLTITRGLVEMHDGTIWAHSDGRGRGATFRVRLPLLKASELGADAVSPADNSAPALAAAPRPARILLVEDHPDTARIMRRLLMLDGHEVQTAGDIATALDLAGDNGRFDLLISDLGLPDGSGVDLMRELRSRGNRIPAIALSGYGQEEDLRRTHEAGFAAHLTKPTSPDRLAEAIASLTAAQ